MKTPEIVGDRLNVSIDEVKPNAYNYNEQKPDTYAKLKASLQRFGFTEPLVVRQIEDGSPECYEIIGGEHRWKSAKELGMKEVPIVNLGKVSDSYAKQLAIVLNELNGDPDELRLASLLAELNSDLGFDELKEVMPFGDAELKMFIESNTFDPIEELEPNDSDEDGVSDFGHSVTLSVEFDTTERRDQVKGMLLRMAKEDDVKPGIVLEQAIATLELDRLEKLPPKKKAARKKALEAEGDG